MSKENVVPLVTDIVNMMVNRINTVEESFDLEQITTVVGLVSVCVVQWLIKDNPNIPPLEVVDYFSDSIHKGVLTALQANGTIDASVTI